MIPDVNERPLKKSRKGIEPPNKPIADSLIQADPGKENIVLNSLHAKMTENKNNATNIFLENVKIEESMPVTPNLFMNIEKPLIKAVKNTKINPFFSNITGEKEKEYK